jgi:cytochrome c-type biogenesis protein
MLGVPFTEGFCPVCSLGVLVALSANAAVGSATYGALLLFVFGIGRTVPVLIGGCSMGYLEPLKSLSRWHHYFEKISGVSLIVMWFYLLNEYYFIF